MMDVDEIPEELETQYLLARKYLDSGKKLIMNGKHVLEK